MHGSIDPSSDFALHSSLPRHFDSVRLRVELWIRVNFITNTSTSKLTFVDTTVFDILFFLKIKIHQKIGNLSYIYRYTCTRVCQGCWYVFLCGCDDRFKTFKQGIWQGTLLPVPLGRQSVSMEGKPRSMFRFPTLRQSRTVVEPMVPPAASQRRKKPSIDGATTKDIQ